jgi:hypothetical protein
LNQKLSDWASIAEIVSGIAVVLTLVFLILGIRENTEVTRASMFQRSTDQLIEFRRDILTDPELADLFQAYVDGDDVGMPGTGQTRLRQLVLNQFQIYEQAYFAERYGLLGPAEWNRFERAVCLFYPRVQATPFIDTVRGAMTPEFMDLMETTCER